MKKYFIVICLVFLTSISGHAATRQIQGSLFFTSNIDIYTGDTLANLRSNHESGIITKQMDYAISFCVDYEETKPGIYIIVERRGELTYDFDNPPEGEMRCYLHGNIIGVNTGEDAVACTAMRVDMFDLNEFMMLYSTYFNQVGLMDFTSSCSDRLSRAYTFLERADFNRDGVITSSDFFFLLSRMNTYYLNHLE